MSKVLPVELVKQTSTSRNCLRCCTLMVCNYYKASTNQKEIWKNLPVRGVNGVYFSEVGKYVLSLGLKVSIHHCEWSWWNKNIVEAASKGGKNLIKSFKQFKFPQREIKFVEKGGRYVFKLPTLKTIDGYLEKKVPVIVALNASDLYHDPKRKSRHTILIIGKKNREYLINDPLGLISKIPEKELEFAWMRNSGYALIVEK